MRRPTEARHPANAKGKGELSEKGALPEPEDIVLQYIDAYYKWVDECRRLDRLVDEGKIDSSAATEKMLGLRSEMQGRLCTSVATREYGLSYPARSTPPPKVPEKILESKSSVAGLVIITTKVLDKKDWYAAFPLNLYKVKKTSSGWRIHELAATEPGNKSVSWRRPS